MVFVASRAVFNPNITTVTLPGLSPTMTHGTIASWVKKPGDLLQVGDVLCEIETDKASVGYDIQDEGVLAKILVPAQGPELKCGSPIALTVEDMAAYEAFLKMDPSSYAIAAAPSAAATTTAATPAAPSSSSGSQALAAVATTKGPQRFSPAARHMLASQRMDPSPITGTAMHGVISKGDVILAINAGIVKANTATGTSQHAASAHASSAPVTAASSPAGVTTNIHPSPSTLAAPVQIPLVDPTGGQPVNARYTDIPNTNMRKIIAKRLTESKATVPHFYTSIECDIDALMALRKVMKKDLDVNVSVNDLVIKSAALALRDVPEANAKWNKKEGKVDLGNGSVDISVAVATPNGLITPIVTGADKVRVWLFVMIHPVNMIHSINMAHT